MSAVTCYLCSGCDRGLSPRFSSGQTKGDEMSDAGETRANELTVLLADDQVPARAGIKGTLEPHGLRVIGEASGADEAVRLATARRPDICVLSVTLPGGGIEAARLIKEAVPETKIVMMTSAAREEEMFGALRAGADGYLLMSTPASRLPHAIMGVARGEAALPREMTSRLILEIRERGTRHRLIVPSTEREVELTAREFQVLDRLRRRERTAQIAARLGVSEVTVRRHAASVLQKLGLPNRRSAIEMFERSE
jgi:two-component system, NarL family, response regulator DevR